MTVCVGWINNGSAFILTDSAATGAKTAAGPEITSIGELQSSHTSQLEETAAKFAQLSESAVGSVIGDAESGLNALEAIRVKLRQTSSIEDALSTFLTEPPGGTPRFQLLLAVRESSRAMLYRIDPFHMTPVQQLYADADPIVLGSLPNDQKEMIKTTVTGICQEEELKIDPELSLSALLAIHQAMGQRNKFALSSVGGMFFGVRVGSEGVRFQNDMVYVIYERANSDVSNLFRGSPVFARSSIREGLMITCSTILGAKVKVFTSNVNQISPEKEKALLDAFVAVSEGQSLYSKSDFYIFLDKNTGASVLLDCRSGMSELLRIDGDNVTIQGGLLDGLKAMPRFENGQAPKIVPIHFIGPKPKSSK